MKKHSLDLHSDYLLSFDKLVTAAGLSEMLEQTISHDDITRF